MLPRKLNALERKLHQAALSQPDNIISQQEIDGLEPRATERLSATNFLLSTGLFVVLSGEGSKLLFRALTHDVIEAMKALTPEEKLVLDRIRASGNQGIWTKHIKSQTQLHQTVVDKALKSLIQRQLVKTVDDVRHPTRKIYMLAHHEPAAELTGGPWYTDKELDSEFIKLLSGVCLKIVRDRSFPKARDNDRTRRLFPLSHPSDYPTATEILAILKKSRVTETELNVQHVEMLLDVLILDGKIEKIPASHTPGTTLDDDDDDGPEPSRIKRLRRIESDSDSSRMSMSDDDYSRRRRRRRRSDSDLDQVSSSKDVHSSRRKRHQQNLHNDLDDEVAGKDVDDRPPKKRRRRHHDRSHPDDISRKGKMEETPSSHELHEQYGHLTSESIGFAPAGPFVYRAIHDERLTLGLINPQECVYHDLWLVADSLLAG